MVVLVFPFLSEGGKGVKKAIKKVASGLVRDSERSWSAELSDKGNFPFKETYCHERDKVLKCVVHYTLDHAVWVGAPSGVMVLITSSDFKPKGRCDARITNHTKRRRLQVVLEDTER